MSATKYTLRHWIKELKSFRRDFEDLFPRRDVEEADPATEVHRNLDTTVAYLEIMLSMSEDGLERRQKLVARS